MFWEKSQRKPPWHPTQWQNISEGNPSPGYAFHPFKLEPLACPSLHVFAELRKFTVLVEMYSVGESGKMYREYTYTVYRRTKGYVQVLAMYSYPVRTGTYEYRYFLYVLQWIYEKMRLCVRILQANQYVNLTENCTWYLYLSSLHIKWRVKFTHLSIL